MGENPYLVILTIAILNKLTLSLSTVSNTCKGVENGEIIQVKLMSDTENEKYPVINVECNNDYMILNYQNDNALQYYFSSWLQYYNSIYGPVNGDQVNWEEWFLPTSIAEGDSFKLIISPDCQTCDESNKIQTSSNKTTYYMNSQLFRCFFSHFKYTECQFDSKTYECYYCDYTQSSVAAIPKILPTAPTENEWLATGTCATAVLASNYYVPQKRAECVGGNTMFDRESSPMYFKPSIGTEGNFCVCYQPSEEQIFEVDDIELEEDDQEEEEEENSNAATIYELYQTNFTYGTYRITKSGTYKIMENIVFDFNAPNDRKNDAFKIGSWWPTIEQNDEYNGAGMYYGSYFLGFFAGITVECDNVVIDLNGLEIKQSLEFYYIQRWFSAIELNNQLFEPGQGPGKWNGLFTIANNVEIKNGNIGLTSHFAIHGNYNKQINIHDVNIYDFDTHGIQLNGFEHLKLININIGPSSNKMNFYGEFGHAMVYLPRLRDVVTQAKEDEVILSMKFNNREKEISADELLGEFEQSLLYAWKYVVYNEKLNYNTATSNDIRIYERSIKTFVNPTGIPYASVVEGIFLNKPRAKAFAYAYYTNQYSNDVIIDNVKIFGLQHKMKESLGADTVSLSSINAISSYIDYSQAFKNFDKNNIKVNGDGYEYDGMIVQDVMFAIEEWDNDNWDLLNVQITCVLDWVKGTKSLTELTNLSEFQSFQTKCNSDVMSHSGKGIIGLRLEGIENGQLSNIQIYDLKDYTEFGMKCSKSEFASAPIQIGFSGNMVQGLSISTSRNIQFADIKVQNLMSNYGDVYGFAIWTNNNLTITGRVEISDISAGQSVSKEDASIVFSYPNLESEACAYRVLTSWNNEDAYNTVVNIADSASVRSSNIVGHIDCFGIEDTKTKLVKETSDALINNNSNNNNNNNNNHIVIYSIFAIMSALMVIGTVSYKSSLKKREKNDASYQLLLPKKRYYYGAI